jgi:hypothetical protein
MNCLEIKEVVAPVSNKTFPGWERMLNVPIIA